MKTKKINTALIKAGYNKHYMQSSMNSVVQRASSFIFNTIEDQKNAFLKRKKRKLFYGRYGTLTHFSLQDAMTELENGNGCALYPSGMAAISNTILAFIKNGDHVLINNAVYENTYSFCEIILKKFGVLVTFFDSFIDTNISKLIQKNTKVVFLESPASITMEVQDIPGIVNSIRKISSEIVIIMDNTWSAGILFKALNYGIDISIQSGTKYIIGHSDYMIGTAVSNKRCWKILQNNSYLMGQMVDADTAYMAIRGLRTLSVRIQQHEKNALKIAKWLEKRSEVYCVNHPALKNSKGHNFWIRDFLGSNGLFSFILKKRLNKKQLSNYLNNFCYFKIAYSWGGYESLILAYQYNDLVKRRSSYSINFHRTLIRIHIGLENTNDLIKDLEKGFLRLI